MILLAVSAIPPIMYKVTQQREEILYEGRHAGYRTETEIKELDESKVVPRSLNPTQIITYGLDGVQYPIDTRLSIFNINNISYDSGNTLPGQLNFKTDLLSDLVAANLANNIIDCWEVPDDYITVGVVSGTGYNPFKIGYDLPATDPRYPDASGGYGNYNTIISRLKSPSIAYVPYSSYAQGVINNKTRYSQSVTIKVYNPASGASLEKNIYDALKAGENPYQQSYTLPYRIAADIRPNGCPIFAFRYNNGGTDQLEHATEYILGGNWSKVQLNVQGVNGSYFDKLSLNQSKEELNTRTAITLAAGAAGLLTGGVGLAMGAGALGIIGESVISNAGTSIVNALNQQGSDVGYRGTAGSLMNRGGMGMLAGGAGIVGGIASYTLSMQKLRHQEEILNARCGIATTPIKMSNSNFFNDTNKNKFMYVFTSYNGEDMRNYDAFLTRYGYNVGKMAIRNRHFYSRLNFNYVKCNEFHAVSNSNYKYKVGRSILEKVETQLKQGVRIWRKKPDAHNMLPDGNNQVNPIAYRSGE